MTKTRTQLEAARANLVTPEMRRVAIAGMRHARAHPRRGRARTPGDPRQPPPSRRQRRRAPPAARRRTQRQRPRRRASRARRRRPRTGSTRPSAQRRRVDRRPDVLRGSRAPKRLDPTGIGRMITTKINANIGASPVSSGTDEEVEKLAVGGAVRGRHGDGPLDRRRPRRDAAQAIIDHAHRPDRHRADLLDDHRPAHRGPDLRS